MSRRDADEIGTWGRATASARFSGGLVLRRGRAGDRDERVDAGLLPVPVAELPCRYPGGRLAAEEVERGFRVPPPPRARDVGRESRERPGSPDLGRHVKRVPVGDRGRGEREERGEAGLLPV